LTRTALFPGIAVFRSRSLLILSSGTRQQGGEQISLEADARLNRSDPEIIRTQIPEVRKTAAAVINPLSVDNHYV
jgi:hypothetical protein